jgi:hypothetical protein
MSRLEQETHLDRVPEFTTRPTVLLDPPSLLNEAELSVERDRPGVVREDAEAELVQPSLTRPLDRCREQCGANTAPAPLPKNSHSDLSKPMRTHIHMDRTDDLALNNSDQPPFKSPCRRPQLNIDRRLGRNSIPLLRNGGKHRRQPKTILLSR